MKGYRKLIMSLAFMGCSTWIILSALQGEHEPDLIGLSTVIGAMGASVGALGWCNVQVHKSNDQKEKV